MNLFYRFLFLLNLFFSISITPALPQIARLWEQHFNPVMFATNSLISLPSGNMVLAGLTLDSISINQFNTLYLLDDSGLLLEIDTNISGWGYGEIIFDGHSYYYTAASKTDSVLNNGTIVVTRFDQNFANKQYFVPLSTNITPTYYVLDMAVLSNTNIVVASRFQASFYALSLVCIDSSGNFLWERVDSTFSFDNNIKIVADSSGGLFVAGSSGDHSPPSEFIFVSHYTSLGTRDWIVTDSSIGNSLHANVKDIIFDATRHLLITGSISDSTGIYFLMKCDTLGNIIWNRTSKNYYRLLSDNTGSTYGIPSTYVNGVDIFTINKIDQSGYVIDSFSLPQLPGYLNSSVQDVKFLDSTLIGVTGWIHSMTSGKVNLFFAVLDNSLNLIGFDIYDTLSTHQRLGDLIVGGNNSSVYVYENVKNDMGIALYSGLIKYDLSGMTGFVTSGQQLEIEIFPNPSEGNFTLKLPVGRNDKANFRIYNLNGIEVFTDVISNFVGLKKYTLKLLPGIYYAAIESQSERAVFRLCITE